MLNSEGLELHSYFVLLIEIALCCVRHLIGALVVIESPLHCDHRFRKQIFLLRILFIHYLFMKVLLQMCCIVHAFN